MKNEKWILIMLLIPMILMPIIFKAYASYLVNKDSSFNNSSYWYLFKPSHNDAPSECITYFDTSNSLVYLKTVDREGSDWSDTVCYQGKALHSSGTWGTQLNGIIYIYPDTTTPLQIQVQMRFQNTPTAINDYPHNPTVSPSSNVAGAFVMLFFEFKYKDAYNNEYWTNINSPNAKDGFPDCFVFEMANRWAIGGNGWYQAPSTSIIFNFFTAHTTHDDDLHDIRCGWTWTQTEMSNHAWKTFTVNVNERYSEWFNWFNNVYVPNEGRYKNIYQITALRLVAVAVSVETYRASYDMQFCDLWVYWN